MEEGETFHSGISQHAAKCLPFVKNKFQFVDLCNHRNIENTFSKIEFLKSLTSRFVSNVSVGIDYN